jgi:RNA polymerase sigma-70 factor (ECF subfamily)
VTSVAVQTVPELAGLVGGSYVSMRSGARSMSSPELDISMARLADGDRSAFPLVFRELWPKLRALCTSLLKNEGDAEDAAQRALEKVLTRAADYDPSRSALSWAFAIAAWECRTVLRARQRRAEVGDAELERLAGPGSGEPDRESVQRELEAAALAALGQLSEPDRVALVAAYWDEAPAGDPASRKRRQRAIERLRLAFRRLYGAG